MKFISFINYVSAGALILTVVLAFIFTLIEFRRTINTRKKVSKNIDGRVSSLNLNHLDKHTNVLLQLMMGIIVFVGGVVSLYYNGVDTDGSLDSIVNIIGSYGSWLIVFAVINTYYPIVHHLKEERDPRYEKIWFTFHGKHEPPC
jgi:uncharacterized membrane protein